MTEHMLLYVAVAAWDIQAGSPKLDFMRNILPHSF